MAADTSNAFGSSLELKNDTTPKRRLSRTSNSWKGAFLQHSTTPTEKGDESFCFQSIIFDLSPLRISSPVRDVTPTDFVINIAESPAPSEASSFKRIYSREYCEGDETVEFMITIPLSVERGQTIINIGGEKNVSVELPYNVNPGK